MPWKRETHGQRMKAATPEALRPKVRRKSTKIYGHRWRKARAAFLAKHPMCATCKANGRDELATVVDHIIPHKGDMTIFWDSSLWSPSCESCHNRKTAQSDGGFGNPLKDRPDLDDQELF